MYSRKFKNIKKSVIEETKEMARKVWTGSNSQERFNAMVKWLEVVSEKYNIEVPQLVVDEDNLESYFASGGGRYISGEHKIVLFHKFSVVTLLHEFRHAVQYKGNPSYRFTDDREKDARAWSMSLFKKACPKSYRKAVEKDIVHFK